MAGRAFPGAGTAITTPVHALGLAGQLRDDEHVGSGAYQSGSGAQVLGANPAFTNGLFNGNTVAGRPCARYYRHFHSEQGKWITGTGTKYDSNYISALAYTELDMNYAYAQSDWCWLMDGL